MQNPSGDSYRTHQKYYYRTCILILVKFGSSLLQNTSQDSLRIYLSIQPESISGFSRCWFTDFFFYGIHLRILSETTSWFLEFSSWILQNASPDSTRIGRMIIQKLIERFSFISEFIKKSFQVLRRIRIKIALECSIRQILRQFRNLGPKKRCRIHLRLFVSEFLHNPSRHSYRFHLKYLYLVYCNTQNMSQYSPRMYLSILPESISGFSPSLSQSYHRIWVIIIKESIPTFSQSSL